MKKFLMAICTAIMLFATTPAQAADYGIELSDVSAENFNSTIEKFYVTLPKAKGDYKSKVRPILIEGAMNTETEVLIRALKNPVAYRDLNYLFVAGTYENYPVVVVRTEIGTANAAASKALAIKKFNPIAVINQGTAGGQDSTLKIGDIVIGESSFNNTAFISDYSAVGAGIDLTKQENIGTYAYDKASGKFQAYTEYFADETLLGIAKKVAAANKNFNVVTGVIGTADSWLECLDYVNFLHEKYGSTCEEMETNAVAQICQNAGLPFIGIRVLSDNVTNSKEYLPETAKVAQDFVLLVVKDYIKTLRK